MDSDQIDSKIGECHGTIAKVGKPKSKLHTSEMTDVPMVSDDCPQGGIDFELAPKGRVRDGEGHFHVIIDHSCEPPSAQIPDDDLHLHVGSGAAETMVELEPGEHSLCVQLGDGFHTALKIFDTINITVEP